MNLPVVRCSSCGATPVATLHHSQRIGRRLVEWDECFACSAKEDARAEQLKREAIEDRAVKLPEPQRARRQSNSLSFIQQIEEADA